MCHAIEVQPSLLATGYKARRAEPTRILSVTLPARLFESLRAEAESRDVPIAAVVRGLLEKGAS